MSHSFSELNARHPECDNLRRMGPLISSCRTTSPLERIKILPSLASSTAAARVAAMQALQLDSLSSRRGTSLGQHDFS